MEKTAVVSGTKHHVKWWVKERKRKLEKQLTDSMSVNPFLMPFLFDYHDLKSFDELADLIIASHLMIGHSTGFGKLMDEKILPNVFGTTKLDKKFRHITQPYSKSHFDEIDHLVKRPDDKIELLSLKASRWTIQLTMAVQLNVAFNKILTEHPALCESIVVGVIFGKKEELTDKYDILRGINRGAVHDVIDLTHCVRVYAGKEFWAWINGDNPETHSWVMEGMLAALEEEKIHEKARELLLAYRTGMASTYAGFVNEQGKIDWHGILAMING